MSKTFSFCSSPLKTSDLFPTKTFAELPQTFAGMLVAAILLFSVTFDLGITLHLRRGFPDFGSKKKSLTPKKLVK